MDSNLQKAFLQVKEQLSGKKPEFDKSQTNAILIKSFDLGTRFVIECLPPVYVKTADFSRKSECMLDKTLKTDIRKLFDYFITGISSSNLPINETIEQYFDGILYIINKKTHRNSYPRNKELCSLGKALVILDLKRYDIVS